jgi:hypothetical protein
VNRLGDGVAAIFDNAFAGRHETRENAQKSRFSRSRFSENRHDLALAQDEINVVEDQPPMVIGGLVSLRYGFGAQ